MFTLLCKPSCRQYDGLRVEETGGRRLHTRQLQLQRQEGDPGGEQGAGGGLQVVPGEGHQPHLPGRGGAQRDGGGGDQDPHPGQHAQEAGRGQAGGAGSSEQEPKKEITAMFMLFIQVYKMSSFQKLWHSGTPQLHLIVAMPR